MTAECYNAITCTITPEHALDLLRSGKAVLQMIQDFPTEQPVDAESFLHLDEGRFLRPSVPSLGKVREKVRKIQAKNKVKQGKVTLKNVKVTLKHKIETLSKRMANPELTDQIQSDIKETGVVFWDIFERYVVRGESMGTIGKSLQMSTATVRNRLETLVSRMEHWL